MKQEPFLAFHRNSIEYVRKFLKPLVIGRLAEEQTIPDSTVREDFDNLRMTAEKMVNSLNSHVASLH